MPFPFISRKNSRKRVAVILCVAIIIVAAILAVLELTNTTHIFHHKENVVVSGTSFNTKGEKQNSTKSSSASGQNNAATPNSSSKSTATGGASSTATLFTPTGSFISNHHPNLSGSPAPNTMSSVCTTTPGASCKITFTKDGITKELSWQTADANGSAYWNWKLQDIGLTTGSWKVQAIASLNGQTKSASDAMNLVVSQ